MHNKTVFWPFPGRLSALFVCSVELCHNAQKHAQNGRNLAVNLDNFLQNQSEWCKPPNNRNPRSKPPIHRSRIDTHLCWHQPTRGRQCLCRHIGHKRLSGIHTTLPSELIIILLGINNLLRRPRAWLKASLARDNASS